MLYGLFGLAKYYFNYWHPNLIDMRLFLDGQLLGSTSYKPFLVGKNLVLNLKLKQLNVFSMNY